MPDKLKEIYEKATDIFFGLTKKFDGLSDKLYKTTGVKVNVGAIILGTILAIFVFVVVKTILGGVMDFLFGR